MAKNSVKAGLVRDYIVERVRSGEYRPGEQLPAEREFGNLLAMNPQTVRRGLEQLVAEGYIIKQARVGNFVNPNLKLEQTAPVVVCLPSQLEEMPLISLSQFFIRGLQESLPPIRYRLMVLHHDDNKFKEQILPAVREQHVNALVTLRGGGLDRPSLEELRQRNITVISIGRPADLVVNYMHWVGIDDQAVLAELLQGLLDRRHEKLLVARYTHTRSVRPGYAQFQQSLDFSGKLESLLEFIDMANPGDTPDMSGVEAALQRLQPRTALVVPDEMAAAHLLRYANREGLTVGKDFSLVCIKNYIPQLNPLPMTSVDTCGIYSQMCCYAGEIIDRINNGDKPKALGRVYPFTIRWTESVVDWRG